MNSKTTKYIEKHGGKRVTQALEVVAIYEALQPIYRWGKSKYDKKYSHTYEIIIVENDSLFPDISVALGKKIPSTDDQTAIVRTSAENTRTEYSNPHPTKVDINGYKVTVASDQVTENTETDIFGKNIAARLSRRQLKFTANSIEARDAVLDWIETRRKNYWAKYNISNPQIYVPRFGDWSSNHSVRSRPLDTVFGKKGQIERIRDDLQMFFDHEKKYTELGMPYHRGYIFYGSPGTGKTSIAQALAHYFKLNIYYLPIASIIGDVNLIDLIQEVPSRSVLLIEDIDVYAAATDRDDNNGRDLPTLAGLLNSLDGVCTPHGLITMMTTNTLEALDEAVTRPGRADVKEEFSHLDNYQINCMAEHFGIKKDLSNYYGRSPAELMEYIKSIKLAEPFEQGQNINDVIMSPASAMPEGELATRSLRAGHTPYKKHQSSKATLAFLKEKNDAEKDPIDELIKQIKSKK